MPQLRVDFYLIEEGNSEAKLLFACKLLEKAYHRGHSVYVFCQHEKEAHGLDELLWTFKEDSFIPHNLEGEGPNIPPPIQLGRYTPSKKFDDILLNLSSEIPPFLTQFRRVIEIVTNEESSKEISRSHFREYRAKNYELHTHKLQPV